MPSDPPSARLPGQQPDEADAQRPGPDAGAATPALAHQFTNAMMLANAVIRRSAETADSLEDYALHLEGRLGSIHRVLAALIRKPGKVFDLCGMIDDELEEQGAWQAGNACRLSGPTVTVGPVAAQVLALLFEELVTNAMQHGALGGDNDGALQVDWTVAGTEAGEELQLDWSESGPVPPPARRGFGMTVVEEVLSYQLDGRTTCSFGRDGLRITLAIPMASLAAGFGDLPGLF